MAYKDLANLFFELGQLKLVEHEGWRLIGIAHPDCVSDHSLRAAQIGFVLAHLENYPNPAEVAAMLVFHDMAECRTGDVHRVANRYVKRNEEAAVKDQVKNLGTIGKEIKKLWDQVEHKNTKAGVIAKDADLLEMAVAAREYIEQGHTFAQDWINNISKALKTKSAKEMLDELCKTNPNDWWQGLKKFS